MNGNPVRGQGVKVAQEREVGICGVKRRRERADYCYSGRGRGKYTGITICKDNKEDDERIEGGTDASIGK